MSLTKHGLRSWALAILSAGLVAGWIVQKPDLPSRVHLAAPSTNEVNLVVFGDWGYSGWSSHLGGVVRQMQRYLESQHTRFDAAILAGDNFYGDLPNGAADHRWQRDFQRPFGADVFRMPFYVALGNHDYSKKNLGAEFEYTQRDPTHRWKLPSKWYAVNFPPNNPLVTVLMLDSNLPRLTPEEREQQSIWLQSTVAAATNAPWLVAVAHHPLFSNGHGGDDMALITQWADLFKTNGVDFYIAGHDHTMQHLEIPAQSTSFLVSGGGGAKLEEIRRADRGPFARSIHGFIHLSFNSNEARVAVISESGEVLHEFTRAARGSPPVIQTTRIEKAR